MSRQEIINRLQAENQVLSALVAEYREDETYAFNSVIGKELSDQVNDATKRYFNEILPDRKVTCLTTIDHYDDQINDLKGRATVIKQSETTQLLKTFGQRTVRFFRSMGIIAAAVIAVFTIIPGIALGISLKSKINDIFHRYVTLKSEEQLDLEKEWQDLRTDLKQEKALHNPLKARVKIAPKDNEAMYNVVNIYDYLKLIEQDNLDEDVQEFDDRLESIKVELSKDLF